MHLIHPRLNGVGCIGCIVGGVDFGQTHPRKNLVYQGFPLGVVY